jgi:hypothetical protein
MQWKVRPAYIQHTTILTSSTEIHKLYKMLRYFTWRAFNFWRVISLLTDSLMISAFILRVWGLYAADDDHSSALKLRSFQVLSCVSPLIWMSMWFFSPARSSVTADPAFRTHYGRRRIQVCWHYADLRLKDVARIHNLLCGMCIHTAA